MDEVIIIQPSARYVVLRSLGTLFVIETIYALAFVLYLFLRPDQSFDITFIIALWALHVIKFVIVSFALADIIIRYLGTRYFITKHHLIVSKGLVSNDEKVYELEQLRKVSAYQDILGKQLNYGSINLLLGARGFEEHMVLVNVANPRRIVKIFEDYLGVTTNT